MANQYKNNGGAFDEFNTQRQTQNDSRMNNQINKMPPSTAQRPYQSNANSYNSRQQSGMQQGYSNQQRSVTGYPNTNQQRSVTGYPNTNQQRNVTGYPNTNQQRTVTQTGNRPQNNSQSKNNQSHLHPAATNSKQEHFSSINFSSEGCEEHYEIRYVSNDEAKNANAYLFSEDLSDMQKIIIFGDVINNPKWKE